MATASFNFIAWLEASTKKSGVPLKVQNAALIARLALLVTRSK